MHSKDIKASEPLWSTLIGPDGEHHRIYHSNSLSGLTESTLAGIIYARDFVNLTGQRLMSHTGTRSLVRVVHGTHAGQVALVVEDNVQSATPENTQTLLTFTYEYCSFLAKHSLPVANPCCEFPCMNGGICTMTETGYFCDCPQGWTGQNCTSLASWTDVFHYYRTPSVKFEEWLCDSILMDVVNNIGILSEYFMKLAISSKLRNPIIPPPYSTSHPYRNLEALLNTSYYSRLLPPVPEGCP